MAQEGPLSPEKQLLKLIEDSKTKSADIRIQKVKRHGLGLLSPGAWIGRFSFFKARNTAWTGGGGVEHFDIRSINSILTVSVLALAFYFFTAIFMSLIDLKKKPGLGFEAPASTETTAAHKASLLKAASFYLEQVRERDIFKTVEAKPSEKETAAPVSSSGIAEAVQNLRLVGIAWSNDPDAMIEDISIPKTYFVKRGAKIGEIKIQAIFKNKVILNYGGQEIELK